MNGAISCSMTRLFRYRNGSISSNRHDITSSPPMSEMGQRRRSQHVRNESAYPPKAARQQTSRLVGSVPIPDSCTAAIAASFDRLVGEQQKLAGDCQPQFSRRLQIDEQLEPGGLLDGQVSWLGAFEDLIHVGRGAPMQVGDARSVGNEAAEFRKLPAHGH